MRLTCYMHGTYKILHLASQEKTKRAKDAVEGISTEILERVTKI